MKNFKKVSLSMLMVPAMVMGIGSLTSCGGGASYGADTYDLDVNIKTEGVTIKMFTGFGSNVNKVLSEGEENLIEQFEALTKINVEYETKGGYDNLKNAINLSATNLKTLPNVANAYPDHMAGYISSNIQLRLDGLIENDKNRNIKEPGSYKNLQGETVTTLPRFNYEDFYKDYTEENETLEFKTDGNGYILGIPFNKSTEVMAYNKTFFDYFNDELIPGSVNKENPDGKHYNGKSVLAANGVGEIKIPTTWAELTTIGTNINSILNKLDVWNKVLLSDGKVYADESGNTAERVIFDGRGFTFNDFRPFSYDSTENLFTTLMRQFGGTLTEVDKTKTGKGYINFDNEIGRKATSLLQQLWDDHVIGIASTFKEEKYCSNPFKGYKSLMNIGSTGGLSNVVPLANKFQLGIAPTLVVDKEHKFVLSQGTSLGLFQVDKADPQREAKLVAAWKLIVFLTQAENGRFSAGTGYFPTCKTATNSQDYQDYLNSKNPTDVVNQQAARINNNVYASETDSWFKFTDPGFRGSSEVRTQIGFIPGYIFNKEFKSIDEMFASVTKKLQDYVKPAA